MAFKALARAAALDSDDAVRLIQTHGEPLLSLNDEAFADPFERFAGARVVLLGEATHGTSEFYRARAAITRRLIERHGFTIVAVEADWPDAARVDRYVRHLAPEPTREEAFARFPSWMWRNAEVAAFTHWLRGHNEALATDKRVEFRGLDIYSLGRSVDAVLRYLEKIDPGEAREARERYGCLSPWQVDPARYGRAVVTGAKTPCDKALLDQLMELLAHERDYAARDAEAYFDAVQNARIARAAEHYYRIMYQGSTESWNLRDRHMFDTLESLLDARAGAKAVVWAHNSHIGNAAATAMGWQGEFNIGELCRTAFRDEAVLIGFGSDRGTVAAADDWDEPMRIMQVRPAREDSHEHVFRRAGLASSLTHWRGSERADLREALSAPRLERAIGVVYRPNTERWSHYFEAVLSEQFDALVWFEETRAVMPLPSGHGQGMPDTYPFGL